MKLEANFGPDEMPSQTSSVILKRTLKFIPAQSHKEAMGPIRNEQVSNTFYSEPARVNTRVNTVYF